MEEEKEKKEKGKKKIKIGTERRFKITQSCYVWHSHSYHPSNPSVDLNQKNEFFKILICSHYPSCYPVQIITLFR
jgi:hypothetical protein